MLYLSILDYPQLRYMGLLYDRLQFKSILTVQQSSTQQGLNRTDEVLSKIQPEFGFI